MSALLGFIVCDKWSAFAGCFFLALRQSAPAFWGIHGAMDNQAG